MARGLITYEENGFPVELVSDRDIDRGIQQGRLRSDTVVRHHHPDGSLSTGRASDLQELRAFFEPEIQVAAPAPPSPAPSQSEEPVIKRPWVVTDKTNRSQARAAHLCEMLWTLNDFGRTNVYSAFRPSTGLSKGR